MQGLTGALQAFRDLTPREGSGVEMPKDFLVSDGAKVFQTPAVRSVWSPGYYP